MYRQAARLLQVSEMRKGLSMVEEHEEPSQSRVRQGSDGVLPLLSAQNQIQEEPSEAHTSNTLRLIRESIATILVCQLYV